tara:strand:- start:98 stop:391 length:294 start_codon:yes stop_codon:yes gene_type:complete
MDYIKDKSAVTALAYIYGIENSFSSKILKQAKVDESAEVKDLTEDEVSRIRSIVDKDFEVAGLAEGTTEEDFRSSVNMNVKRLTDSGAYQGLSHLLF